MEFNSPHAICHICGKHIKNNEIKCRDHCHLTGQYRGPVHQYSNLNYRIIPDEVQIPCFFHNLKHYDAHLLITAAKTRHCKIKVIPLTTEKSFTIGDVIIKDSLVLSLDKLVENLESNQLVAQCNYNTTKIYRGD